MKITGLSLTNWRNFKSAEASFGKRVTYLVGPNASGKSNFLDALKFLRDISKPINGGLRTALESRGGFRRVRCLHAHGLKKGGGTDLGINIVLKDGLDTWTYDLAVNNNRHGKREYPIVRREIVTCNNKTLLSRPTDGEREDELRLSVTHLEQAAQNQSFRKLSDFFSKITYVHLVPQLLKFSEHIGGRVLEDDPYGQAFMQRIGETRERTRTASLNRIATALQGIIPGLEGLSFEKDEMGRPHIKMGFQHFRKYPSKQTEDQMSDGTLRLISLLWLLDEKDNGPLLLEEPELSLNEEIVRELHELFVRMTRKREDRQILVSTHSYALLSNPGISAESVLEIIPSAERGSTIAPLSAEKSAAILAGIPVGDVVLRRPHQMSLNF